MLVKVRSVANIGLVSVLVTVEVDVAEAGFPGFTIVGLASKAVEEARERVKTAIHNSGMDFPPKKITVNLAPADLPKEGGAYDLPIAVGILAASGQILNSPSGSPSLTKEGEGGVRGLDGLFYGELSLDGGTRATKGVLLVGLFAKGQIFVPIESANEAAVVEGITVYPVRNLKQLVDHLNGVKPINQLINLPIDQLIEDVIPDFDLADVAGQEQAKRALTLAAAGGHNLV